MNKLVVAGVSLVTFFVYFAFLTTPTMSYGRMVTAFLVVAGVGAGAMLVARYAVTVSKTVTLTGVTEGYALRSAQQSLWSVEDHVLGWPSGTFEFPKELNDGGHRLVAREWLTTGSGNIVMSFISVPWKIVLVLTGLFSVFGWIGALVAFVVGLFAMAMFIYLFVVPLALAWLVEIALKPALRSEIVVTAEQVDAQTARLTFRFRGASAFLAQKRVLGAFEPPRLPPRYAGLAEPAADTSTSWS